MDRDEDALSRRLEEILVDLTKMAGAAIHPNFAQHDNKVIVLRAEQFSANRLILSKNGGRGKD